MLIAIAVATESLEVVLGNIIKASLFGAAPRIPNAFQLAGEG